MWIGRRIGSGRLKRMMHGRKSWLGRLGGQILNFMVGLCFHFSFESAEPISGGIDDAHAARRRYKKDLDQIKPDLAAYNRQKELAMGLAPGSLVSFDPSSSQVCFVTLPLLLILKRMASCLYRS